jgi:catechol 2,3-dioxygenase-like lactoylglutathione lyase family enzyme
MPVTQGFNHIATMTPDLDRLIKFYADAFGGEVTFEIPKTDDHPGWPTSSSAGARG